MDPQTTQEMIDEARQSWETALEEARAQWRDRPETWATRAIKAYFDSADVFIQSLLHVPPQHEAVTYGEASSINKLQDDILRAVHALHALGNMLNKVDSNATGKFN